MSSLGEVSLLDLERISYALERSEPGTVLSREVLVRAQHDHLAAHLGGLIGRDVATARAVLDAVIAERRRPPATKVSLVWTGPETRSSGARDTSVVEDARFATELVRQFHDAVGAGLFVAGTP